MRTKITDDHRSVYCLSDTTLLGLSQEKREGHPHHHEDSI